MQGNGINANILPIKNEVPIGTVVYAGKVPGFIDTAMTIGKVSQCRQDAAEPLLWDITVEPACDITTLENVAVIIMNPEN